MRKSLKAALEGSLDAEVGGVGGPAWAVHHVSQLFGSLPRFICAAALLLLLIGVVASLRGNPPIGWQCMLIRGGVKGKSGDWGGSGRGPF